LTPTLITQLKTAATFAAVCGEGIRRTLDRKGRLRTVIVSIEHTYLNLKIEQLNSELGLFRLQSHFLKNLDQALD
jgi:hypothetical protein